MATTSTEIRMGGLYNLKSSILYKGVQLFTSEMMASERFHPVITFHHYRPIFTREKGIMLIPLMQTFFESEFSYGENATGFQYPMYFGKYRSPV